ncbi:ribosomal RNA small subunit methyltransferase E [Pullulanibacillus camelliae]|uniref:Ribosomal RNA small subunit methyltransferase E n=1 Tax=Pullulanibacillus camelliae TaxID=1707096 RepID=A0A8J2YJJ5_9BACL|nr:16S rRNA (uracil(1498)-N(3))-methyltransferase [Pullulanibacillus camelliae]GGE47236.1 ribosomal RNA small subunit methyltransferase E [Pullulanibacillus camelliae]
MQRYFVPDRNINENCVKIVGDDAYHIYKVMRMLPSDHIIVCDQEQRAYDCQITAIAEQEKTVTAEIVEQLTADTELPVQVTIAQGLVKGDKLDWIVQKGTELGARSFIPYVAERSVVKWEGSSKIERKRQRLEKIAKEAAEQSHRMTIPAVQAPKTLQEILNESNGFDYCLVAYEEEAKQGNQSGLPKLLDTMPKGATVLAVIGPEGGLSEAEIAAFLEHGFVSCGLGKRILRAETAPLYLLSTLSFYFELLKEVK